MTTSLCDGCRISGRKRKRSARRAPNGRISRESSIHFVLRHFLELLRNGARYALGPLNTIESLGLPYLTLGASQLAGFFTRLFSRIKRREKETAALAAGLLIARARGRVSIERVWLLHELLNTVLSEEIFFCVFFWSDKKPMKSFDRLIRLNL